MLHNYLVNAPGLSGSRPCPDAAYGLGHEPDRLGPGLGTKKTAGDNCSRQRANWSTAARIQPGEHVVDVGAGTGNVALLATDLGARVTAVEPAARLREVIQQGRDAT